MKKIHRERIGVGSIAGGSEHTSNNSVWSLYVLGLVQNSGKLLR